MARGPAAKLPLSEQLASLFSPTPRGGVVEGTEGGYDYDPEALEGFGFESRSIFSAEGEEDEGLGFGEGVGVRGSAAGKGKRKGRGGEGGRKGGRLTIRGEIEMEGPEYAGKTVSRSKLMGEDGEGAEEDEDEGEEETGDGDEEEEEEGEEDAEMMNGEGAGESGQSEDEEGDEDEDEYDEGEEEGEDDDSDEEEEEEDVDIRSSSLEGPNNLNLPSKKRKPATELEKLEDDFDAILREERGGSKLARQASNATAGRRSASSRDQDGLLSSGEEGEGDEDDEEDEDEEDEEEDEGEEEGGNGQPLHRGTSSNRGGEGGEMLFSSSRAANQDADKGRGVALQRALWENLLEVRILLQRSLNHGHRLPRGPHLSVFLSSSSSSSTFHVLEQQQQQRPQQQQEQSKQNDVTREHGDVIKALKGALHQCMDVGRGLREGNAAMKAAEAVVLSVATGEERSTRSADGLAFGGNEGMEAGEKGEGGQPQSGREGLAREDGLDALWKELSEEHEILRAFADAAVDRWHRKTLLSSGALPGAAGGSSRLRALNQTVSQQLQAAMRNPDRLIRRAQIPRSASTVPIGSAHSLSVMTAGTNAARVAATSGLQSVPAGTGSGPEETAEEGARGDQGTDGSDGAGGDPDSYDDAEFYQQLLRELLDSSSLEELGAIGLSAAVSRSKRKKAKLSTVDRRASKGRKIRYTPMPQLVNFMAPEPIEVPPLAEQLFGRLFGMEPPPQ